MKKNTTGSIGSRRLSVKAKRFSIKSKQSTENIRRSLTSGISGSIKSEEQPIINYKEKLTTDFFNILFKTIIREKSICESQLDILREIREISTSKNYRELSNEDLRVGNVISISGDIVALENPEASTSSQKIRSRSTLSEGLTNSSSKSTIVLSQDSNHEYDCAIPCLCKFQAEKILFNNGNCYKGQVQNNLMHGKGNFYWVDGSVYEGDFKNGFPSGRGAIVLPDLSRYEGDFCTGTFHGFGTLYITSSPTFYHGEWRYGKKHGTGWLLYEPQNWYDGEWAEDERQGVGFRKYRNGVKYKGNWQNNERNRKGSIIWPNNDYYNGEWCDGLQNGYGEYIWNVYRNHDFVYPNYNWYKGNWVNGERNGVGIMHFGHECGSKLAGSWENNNKHGPGLMICGNGVTMQRSPLFLNDKPVNLASRETSQENLRTPTTTNIINAKKTYGKILQQVSSKVNLGMLYSTITTEISKHNRLIKPNQHIKLLGSTSKINISCPLKIPIHTIAEELDLDYYVELILGHHYPKSDSKISVLEIKSIISGETIVEKASRINYIPSTIEDMSLSMSSTESLEEPVRNEDVEKHLRYVITENLPELHKIYYKYATIASECHKKIPFTPVLIRLFLWQLYYDMELPKKGISLLESDNALSRNPSSCTESYHYPFEPIYFWQFIQSVVGNACQLFLVTNKEEMLPSSCIAACIFKSFLSLMFQKTEKQKGIFLSKFKDMVSVKNLYDLYLQVGDSHTVADFLQHSCLNGKAPPCYQELKYINFKGNIKPSGSNVIIMGHNLEYLVDESVREFENDSPIFGLYTFDNLGRKLILMKISEVCPQILVNKRYNMNYKISFLEFCEILYLLAYTKVEREEALLKQEQEKQLDLRLSEIISCVPDEKYSIISLKDKMKKKKEKKK